MKKAFAFVLAAASAYALSFAADLLVAGLLHIYPSAVYKAVPTWTIIAIIAGIAAVRIARARMPVVVPFALITCIATFGGIVGHKYNFIVAGVMLLATLLAWVVSGWQKPTETKYFRAAP